MWTAILSLMRQKMVKICKSQARKGYTVNVTLSQITSSSKKIVTILCFISGLWVNIQAAISASGENS